jgi:YbbR domain-containing protein
MKTSLFARWVVHNFWLKVLAIIAAVALWTAIAREPLAEIGFTVPIEFHHVPEDLEIISESAPQAQVRVRAPARVVREVTGENIHPVIDLLGAVPGERTYELRETQITVPYNVEVVQVVPSQFSIAFDRRAAREVKVNPRVTGTFASGYRLQTITVDPPTVNIVGPAARVAAVESATTDVIDATGVMGAASFSVVPYIPDPLVRMQRPKPVRVTVVTAKQN